jgi:hypothetical protein
MGPRQCAYRAACDLPQANQVWNNQDPGISSQTAPLSPALSSFEYLLEV